MNVAVVVGVVDVWERSTAAAGLVGAIAPAAGDATLPLLLMMGRPCRPRCSSAAPSVGAHRCCAACDGDGPSLAQIRFNETSSGRLYGRRIALLLLWLGRNLRSARDRIILGVAAPEEQKLRAARLLLGMPRGIEPSTASSSSGQRTSGGGKVSGKGSSRRRWRAAVGVR